MNVASVPNRAQEAHIREKLVIEISKNLAAIQFELNRSTPGALVLQIASATAVRQGINVRLSHEPHCAAAGEAYHLLALATAAFSAVLSFRDGVSRSSYAPGVDVQHVEDQLLREVRQLLNDATHKLRQWKDGAR